MNRFSGGYGAVDYLAQASRAEPKQASTHLSFSYESANLRWRYRQAQEANGLAFR